MPVIATAEVDVRAKLDEFDRNMSAVHARMTDFDKATANTKQQVKEFESGTGAAAKVVELFNNIVNKAAMGVDVLSAADRKALDALKQLSTELENATKRTVGMSAANDNMSASYAKLHSDTANSKQSLDAHSQATEHASKSFIHTGLEVVRFAGLLKLGSTVAYQASPTYAKVADSVTAMVKPHAEAAVQALGLGKAVEGTSKALEPFMKIAGGLQIASLASHMTLATTAAYTMVPAFRAVANQQVLGGIQAIKPAIANIAPAATATGTAVKTATTAFTGLATTVARVAIPIVAVVTAFKLLVDLFKLGQSSVDKFVDGMQKASDIGVSSDYFTKMTESAKKFKLTADDATATLTRFSQAAEQHLGGSQLEATFKELQKAGNEIGAAGLKALKSSSDVETQYRAVSKVITDAIAKGERLAALKVAEGFVSPAALQRLKATGDFLADWQKKADEISKVDLIGEQNLAKSLELKRRLDDAYQILNQKWELGVMPRITQLSLNFYGIWVRVVEVAASVVDWFGKLLDTALKGLAAIRNVMQAIQGVFDYLDNKLGSGKIDKTISGMESGFARLAHNIGGFFQEQFDTIDRALGLDKLNKKLSEIEGQAKETAAAVASIGSGVTTGPTQEQLSAGKVLLMEDAYRKLTIGMSDAKNMLNAARQATEIASAVFKDHSKVIDENARLWDRMVSSIKRHIAVQKAEAEAMNQGVGAVAALRVQLELEAMAESRHIPITAKMRSQINALKKDASAAALALAEMRLQTSLRFEFQTIKMGLTDEDVKIAQELNKIYGEKWQSMMDSNIAQQMRFVATLKATKDAVVGVGVEFESSVLSNLRAGQRASDAFGNALISSLGKIEDQLASMLTKALLERTVGPLISEFLTSVVGGTATSVTTQTAGATTAAGILTAAGEAVAAAMISGATAAAGILSEVVAAEAAVSLVALQSGGIVGMRKAQQGVIIPTPPSGMGTGVPILAHPGEEVIRRDNPRHALNQGNGSSNGGDTHINVNFSANGRFSRDEIEGHANTISKVVADNWSRNKGNRPTY